MYGVHAPCTATQSCPHVHCDHTPRVEHVLKSCGAGLLWVTHDDDQPTRVGGSFLQLPEGSVGVIEPCAEAV